MSVANRLKEIEMDGLANRRSPLRQRLVSFWVPVGAALVFVVLELTKDRVFGSLNDWLDQLIAPLFRGYSLAENWRIVAALMIMSLGIGWKLRRCSVGETHSDEVPRGDPYVRALEARADLERAAQGAAGTSVLAEYEIGRNFGEFEIDHAGVIYGVMVQPRTASTTVVWAQSRSMKGIVAVFGARRGEFIDLRQLKPARERVELTINQHAIVLGVDGTVIQLLLTGLLDMNVGDDRDEARFQYMIHKGGDFLVAAL